MRGLENLVAAVFLVAIAITVSIVAFELMMNTATETSKTVAEIHLTEARLVLLGVGGGSTGGASYVLQATISNTGGYRNVTICIVGPSTETGQYSSPVIVDKSYIACRSIGITPGTHTYSLIVDVDSQYLSHCPGSIQTCPVDEGWVVALMIGGTVKETIVPEYEAP